MGEPIKLDPALCRRMAAWLCDMTRRSDDVRFAVAEQLLAAAHLADDDAALQRRLATTTAALAERPALTADEVQALVCEAVMGARDLDGKFSRQGRESAAGRAVSAEQRDRIVTIADEAFGLGPVEPLEDTLTRIERGIFEQHQRLANLEMQREADLCEAFLAGVEHGDGWSSQASPEAMCGSDDEAAAEYARSKAGG